ncbi:hypothetical protein FHX42_000603 [Saccharopolyspora lacisalsi]|uniref:Uncharacterized protein n=1 Tax=Halosaccharopolyspora lacisalsi TaxID=1000566 RepID=A0A839DP72_9PSEU|nr:hypothetical protein [Halosaccharopolyspora lacisalsi]MBA8823274.1 hypothetical protein [Halosaccharopolyspora lacisalsi]
MIIRAGKPVTAGLSRVARMEPRERARIVGELYSQHPVFRSLLRQVNLARTVGFGSALMLAVAVMLLVQDASVWCVCVLVLAGMAGFGFVTVVLTDNRFDLLMAVIGAHRTDELHGQLVAEEVYEDEVNARESRAATPEPRASRSVTAAP